MNSPDSRSKAQLLKEIDLLNTKLKESKNKGIKDNKKYQARLLDLIFEHSLDSIVLLDKDYNFIRVSKTYAEACQKDISEFTGKNHFELYPSDIIDEFDEVKKNKSIYQRTARPFVFPDHPEWGTTYWNLGLVPILDENNEIEMFLFTLREVTENKKYEDALLESDQRWQFAADGSALGLWDWNSETNEVFFSKQWKAMLGYGENEISNNPKEWDERIHPDDLEDCLAKLNRHYKGETPFYENEHRMLCKDGSYKWILDRGKVVSRNKMNKPLRVIGTQTDISGIKQAEIEIARLYEEIKQELNQRKKIDHELIIAKEKAEGSDRLKSAFLATMSHELRTPLNAIIGFSDLINPNWPIEDIYDFANTINSSGLHLLNIVEDLFDITLIESGETIIQKRSVDLIVIMKEIHEIMKAEQQKSEKVNIGLNLIIPSENKNLFINTDSSRFKQILINLLKNALKFTHDGHINYGFTVEDIQGKAMIKFYVSDTGIGISKSKQKLIFNLFRQIDDSHTRTYEGIGIGLSISKKLTELLGGNIWLESEEGVGSSFYFTLPYDDIGEYYTTNEETTETEAALEEETNTNNKVKTLLIVEDDIDSFEFLKILLEMANMDAIWAQNGKEAITYCHENPNIDLVLMDINMPVMNGYKATKEIKKFRPKLPIIAQTAYAIAGDKENALDAGCDDYISKPIKREELMEKINRLI